ncbi:response regulator [Mucilaginibacter agri]|uniref:Response regulator n=1 Tax=Mucilaginibacter agri TaxID=2695265 RepID=A0A965ZCZ1_9SPHI|nr:response regulator transcription factor [Mucilaginibacter agri]NCD68734.1 response regulator [Mucilaginibacter agri]
MEKIAVAIVDDQNIFRQMLSRSIALSGEFAVTGTYENGVEFIKSLTEGHPAPHIATIDIDMPEMNGMELNAKIQADYPHIKTIILSQHTEERIIANMIHAGAAAYLDKGCKQEELFLAIKTVYQTGYYMNADTLRSLTRKFTHTDFEPQLPEALSSREVEVLKMICEEYTNVEIAERMHISAKTVDFHRANLLKKTNSRNVVGLIKYALKNKFTSL